MSNSAIEEQAIREKIRGYADKGISGPHRLRSFKSKRLRSEVAARNGIVVDGELGGVVCFEDPVIDSAVILIASNVTFFVQIAAFHFETIDQPANASFIEDPNQSAW